MKFSRSARADSGQSLLETAMTLPLLLGVAFNAINYGYFWFMVLTLSAVDCCAISARTGADSIAVATAAATSNVVMRFIVSLQGVIVPARNFGPYA